MILKISAGFFSALFFAALVMFPPLSRWSGSLADFTYAEANQDMPACIIYDRDFDWPTGEVSWIEVPAWRLHLGLLCCAAGCLVVDRCRKKMPNTALEPTADSAFSLAGSVGFATSQFGGGSAFGR